MRECYPHIPYSVCPCGKVHSTYSTMKIVHNTYVHTEHIYPELIKTLNVILLPPTIKFIITSDSFFLKTFLSSINFVRTKSHIFSPLTIMTPWIQFLGSRLSSYGSLAGISDNKMADFLTKSTAILQMPSFRSIPGSYFFLSYST